MMSITKIHMIEFDRKSLQTKCCTNFIVITVYGVFGIAFSERMCI